MANVLNIPFFISNAVDLRREIALEEKPDIDKLSD